jgi:hypothetical protein
MRYTLLLPLALLGLTGCVVQTPPAPATAVVTPAPTATYVTPPTTTYVSPPTTTVIHTP